MAAWARQATQPSRLSSLQSSASSFIPLRGLAGAGGDHHGPSKVNFWEDPVNPSRWKEEHFVIVSLVGWGSLFYVGYKYFTRGNKDDKNKEAFKNPSSIMSSIMGGNQFQSSSLSL